MRVVLELLNGPEKGRKMRLAANQTISVGRTEWADFVVGSDPHLSSKHFSLVADREDCQLHDLGSANGTCLNGAPSKIALLKNGDKITAGDSQFVVRIESDTTTQSLAPEPALERRKAEVPVKITRALAPTCEVIVQPAPSQLYLGRCLSADFPPVQLVERLAAKYPLHLIVDFGRLGTPRPESLKQAPVVFDWLPEPAAAVSPVMILACDMGMAVALIKAGWGLDAIVCLFSSEPPDRLIGHVRAQTRTPKKSGVVGYCWPSVLGPLLTNSPTERARQMMDGVNLVLVEDSDSPADWQVFSLNNLQSVFDKIGVRTAAPAQSPAPG